MKTSENVVDLMMALVKAQAKIGAVLKDNKANIPTKSGGNYSYSYADLGSVIEAALGPLNENDIVVLQPPESVEDGQIYVETWLFHAPTGQYVCAKMPIAVRAGADAQAIGSGMTYARRYIFLSLLFMRTEDDDGAQAVNSHQSQQNGNGRSQDASSSPFKADRPLPSVNLNSTQLTGLLSRDQLIEWIKFHGPLRSDGQAATYDDAARHVTKRYNDENLDASTLAPIDRAKLQNFLKKLRTQR